MEGLSRELEGLVEGPESEGITEIIFFRGSKWTFVRSDQVQNHLRRYHLNADIRHRRELVDSDQTTVSLQDLKRVDCGELANKIKEDFKKKSEGKIEYDLTRLDDLTLALRR